MRRAAWRKQGIVVLRVADVRDELIGRPAATRQRGLTDKGR